MTATATVDGRVRRRILADEPWKAEGLCREVDPELWFPERGEPVTEAKKLCHRCHVERECLDYALRNDEKFGVWGGLSERERRRLKRS